MPPLLNWSVLPATFRLLRLTVKTKIWLTVTSIVLLFSFFVLFYLPAIQERYLLNNFNKEVQNHANTVALGVKIAMTEQNFEGVQTAMDFVKQDPLLRFVSLLQTDTVWNAQRSAYHIKRTVFKTYPEGQAIAVEATSNDTTVIKRAPFSTPMMSGEILLASSTRDIIQSRRQIRITSLLFSFLVFSIGIVIGFGLARNISVPVLELRDAARRVGRGDLTQRVHSKSRDEIGELGVAFNKMVTDLALARQEIEDRTRELLLEKKKSDELLADLRQTLADLKETQEQLIRQEKLASLGQLTKGLVDRLLNPLNYVSNFAALATEFVKESQELLAGAPYATDTHLQTEVVPLLTMVEQNTQKIEEHGQSLTRIVRSMDKLLQAKSDVFIATPVNSFVEAQLLTYRKESQLASTGIALEFIQDGAPPTTCVSILPAEMNLVLVNLLNNAVYSLQEKAQLGAPFEPRVVVTTSFAPECVAISIQDNGRGIAGGDLPQLFSPFFTTKPTSKGTGLGLFISQDIIRTHKGSLAVETEPERWTRFIITLPLAPAALS
ncbi:HAMP domain-containing protein [Hymenobacter sp. BT188]|uniref:sensor histidine kinase n=1 Tax=Hymenobacter sp. BT188 TaxID=2763504 RepID=UPI0016517DF8|nr:ATP-binding protein [Hymenobacter sp. BT188]MBC6608820.1 HAMP domain-containing protein [Hymenobacter sp. BT188]